MKGGNPIFTLKSATMTAQIQPIYLPLQFPQVLEIVKQLGLAERQKLLIYLLGRQGEKQDATLTHFASEAVLSQDWLSETEDGATITPKQIYYVHTPQFEPGSAAQLMALLQEPPIFHAI